MHILGARLRVRDAQQTRRSHACVSPVTTCHRSRERGRRGRMRRHRHRAQSVTLPVHDSPVLAKSPSPPPKTNTNPKRLVPIAAQEFGAENLLQQTLVQKIYCNRLLCRIAAASCCKLLQAAAASCKLLQALQAAASCCNA